MAETKTTKLCGICGEPTPVEKDNSNIENNMAICKKCKKKDKEEAE